MDMDLDAERFIAAPLIARAVLLLRRAFRDPREPVSLVNVASAVTAAVAPRPGSLPGGDVLGGSSRDPEVLRLVSEAWQVLESARLVCRDLEQRDDWWLLTSAGRQARDSSDPEGEIRLRVVGI
jgi:hypothetical protein